MSRRVSVLITAAVLAAIGGATPVPAQQSQAGGDVGTAGTLQADAADAGNVVELTFTRPTTVPFDPLVSVQAGSVTTVMKDALGETSAFASAVYPGDLVAGAGGLIGLLGFPVGQQVLPPDHPISQLYRSFPALIPPYPLASRGSFPGEPGRKIDVLADITQTFPLPVPLQVEGAVQETNVNEGFTTAAARLGTFRLAVPAGPVIGAIPGLSQAVSQAQALLKPFVGGANPVDGFVVEVRGANASSSLLEDEAAGVVQSQTETVVSELNLLGGLVRLGRLRTFIERTADQRGVQDLRHGFEVGAITVLGANARLTEGGLELADARIPTGAAGAVQSALDTFMERAGIEIVPPTTQSSGSARAVRALGISMAFTNPPIPAVLPPGTGRIIVDVGRITSTLSATTATPAERSAGLSDGGLPGEGADTFPGEGGGNAGSSTPGLSGLPAGGAATAGPLPADLTSGDGVVGFAGGREPGASLTGGEVPLATAAPPAGNGASAPEALVSFGNRPGEAPTDPARVLHDRMKTLSERLFLASLAAVGLGAVVLRRRVGVF